jgi:hypothetical protein
VSHKFQIGQQVEYSPPRGNYAPRGTYLVTKLLPEKDVEFEYFIRSAQEAHAKATQTVTAHYPGDDYFSRKDMAEHDTAHFFIRFSFSAMIDEDTGKVVDREDKGRG